MYLVRHGHLQRLIPIVSFNFILYLNIRWLPYLSGYCDHSVPIELLLVSVYYHIFLKHHVAIVLITDITMYYFPRALHVTIMLRGYC